VTSTCKILISTSDINRDLSQVYHVIQITAARILFIPFMQKISNTTTTHIPFEIVSIRYSFIHSLSV